MIEQRFYKLVSNNSSESINYTIEDGVTLYLKELGGNAVYNNNVKVEIIWNSNETLLATHGDTVQRTTKELVGDGIKTITIKLTNDSDQSETIGAYFIGELH